MARNLHPHPLTIGEEVWVRDENRRHYDKNGRIIFADSFVRGAVTGETRDYWVVTTAGKPKHFRKDDWSPRTVNGWQPPETLATPAMARDDIWANLNTAALVDLLRANPALARTAAAAVGMTETPPDYPEGLR